MSAKKITLAVLAIGIGVSIYWFVVYKGQNGEPLTQEDKIAYYAAQKRVGDLQVGDEAPDFQLEMADGKQVVQLSSFEGHREVVLVFGSYT